MPCSCLFKKMQHRNIACPFLYKHPSQHFTYLFSPNIVKLTCYNNRVSDYDWLCHPLTTGCGSAEILARIGPLLKIWKRMGSRRHFTGQNLQARSLNLRTRIAFSFCRMNRHPNVHFFYFDDSTSTLFCSHVMHTTYVRNCFSFL